LPYLPIRLWLESTNQCNLRCIVCPNATDTESERGNMDMDLYRSILDQCRGQVNDINLSHRGEPLFHPDLEEMVVLARQAGMGTRIHTNATILDRDRTERLLKAEPDLVSFSFDGYDKDTYESVRRGGVFEETFSNITQFLALKREQNRQHPYTVIQIIQPPDTDEAFLRRLWAFGDQFRQLGLDKFYVKQAHNWAGNAPGESIDMHGYTPCTFLYYSLTVLWNGDVTPCPQDWYCTMPMGNAGKESIQDIWNGSAMIEHRRRIHQKDLSGLLCAQCDRVIRPTFAGVPTENLRAFFGETLAGYTWVRKLIRK
jgi:radical SAM protein with 4Fe4S-binding SPASM domain